MYARLPRMLRECPEPAFLFLNLAFLSTIEVQASIAFGHSHLVLQF